jgi:hypothetical protein
MCWATSHHYILYEARKKILETKRRGANYFIQTLNHKQMARQKKKSEK